MPSLTCCITSLLLATVVMLFSAPAVTARKRQVTKKPAMSSDNSVRKKRVSGCNYEAHPTSVNKAVNIHTGAVHNCNPGTTFVLESCICQLQESLREPELLNEADGSGDCALTEHLTNPQLYYQTLDGHGTLLRTCPLGTVFSQADCGCIRDTSTDPPPTDVSTSPTCDKGAIAGDENNYKLYVVGQGWITMPCAGGTIFSLDDCGCIVDNRVVPPTGDTVTSSSCPNYASVESNPNVYQQYIAGHGWLTRPCPGGTTFSIAACRCTR